jgi:hypothetical protein
MLSLDLSYVNNIINCNHITSNKTTYWCPPVIKRGNNSQNTRVISFSYIRKNLLQSVLMDNNVNRFMIYDNTLSVNLTKNRILGIYPSDAHTEIPTTTSWEDNYPASNATSYCDVSYFCKYSSIGVPNWLYINTPEDSSLCNASNCKYDCSSDDTNFSPCENFKSFINSPLTKDSHNNELIIKSWNYGKNKLTGNGIKYDQSNNLWKSQLWGNDLSYIGGWSDVSFYSQNKNIPLLAFGISVLDKTT